MIAGKSVLAFVMAGGEGSRLHPLTAERSKPSVPFNGRHRIVDFVLSNLVNSEIYSIYLLVQYKSQSLIEHIRRSWVMSPLIPHHYVTVVPPQMQHGPEWFQGTADSVYQNLHLIDLVKPELVVVFGADHVYRMDLRQMIEFHIATQADATVAALPVPLEYTSSFGIIRTDSAGRIRDFREKPESAEPMPGRPGHALASMGNYVFSADLLVDALMRAHSRGGHDFGKNLLPAMAERNRVMAYDFTTNRMRGIRDYEEPAYWRDVGTIDAYYEANFDTLGEFPKFCMSNPYWPIYANPDQTEAAQVHDGHIGGASLGAGVVIRRAVIERSLLRREVVVEEGAQIADSIIMDRSVIGPGARIRRAIIDQHNFVPSGMKIGYDLEADRQRFHISESGVVVVGKGQLKP
ncbi:glucose-1-phosphate adenylyltransferase [Aromatoleum bremense]|uniref:Glucose-1-phosphate adenylyltransferase n=1 Tax=Aromatoleum bremense TaxID=76115 RepID=A0ABX1NYN7_9RHOO|nr:glucose-1-phosphate adenylyltransferase [Aromatoleum bremense]NMG17082.1 glucose-1-phosphate adenylyltransferase [Aromatoleum bremense]QTQ33446.1 Glucose-1-phosphate adenylyltransferase [Aromatoleum bremense]